jgi:choloylglycine hydrolase
MRRFPALLLLFLAAAPAFPCSTFCLARDGEVLFGRNYDFEIGQGYVMTNRRGVSKTSMAGTLQWKSRYGSVTFNQWGREFPMDGMNEAGLVVALMWLDETEYPRDARPALRVLEWIQYQLDSYGSVEEMLAHAEETRIGGGTPLHYLVADASGDAATIEYLHGVLTVHRGATLPAPNLTNDSYARSLSYLQTFQGFGGGRPMPAGFSSLERFARTAMLARGERPSVDRAFEILASVAQPGWTRWSIVYDMQRRELHWVTDENRSRKTIRFAALDFDCGAAGKMLDAHATLAGDVSSRLLDYESEVNRDLVATSYASTSFTRDQPQAQADKDAAHAESMRCDVRRRSVR